MAGVGCPKAGACRFAAFAPASDGYVHGLNLSFDGQKWHIEKSPLPANAGVYDGILPMGIDCPAVGECTAIAQVSFAGGDQQAQGYYIGRSFGRLVVERLQAGHWMASVLPTPWPSGPIALTGLVCPAADQCVATLQSFVPSTTPPAQGQWKPFALDESKKGWKLSYLNLAPPGTTPVPYGQVSSLACTGPGACFAVGDGVLLTDHKGMWSTSSSALAGGLNCRPQGCIGATATGIGILKSGAWQYQSVPGTQVQAFACSNWPACTAFGSNVNSATESTYVHGQWTTQMLSVLGEFHSVGAASCSTATRCALVSGDTDYMDAVFTGFMLVGSGISWQAVSAVAPPNIKLFGQPSIDSAACSGSGCVGVADYMQSANNNLWNRGLIVERLGGIWKSISAPAPSSQSSPPVEELGFQMFNYAYQGQPGFDPSPHLGISCATKGGCVAIGTYIDKNGYIQGMFEEQRKG